MIIVDVPMGDVPSFSDGTSRLWMSGLCFPHTPKGRIGMCICKLCKTGFKTDKVIRSIFLDIDGTLVSFKTHRIPDSTVEALAQAKANGIGIYISTGRPIAIITNLGQIENLIDGYITTNGALCFVGEDIIYCNPIPQEDVDALVADCKAHDYACLVVGERDVALMNPKEVFHSVFEVELNVTNVSRRLPISGIGGQRVLQFSPFISADHEKTLMQKMVHCVSGRWHPAFTDITSRQADKGKGLVKMAAHLGLDISETMAFGDGGNDISILRQAGIGVAMGNADDAVKAAADYVTSSVDDDGVRKALQAYNVI